MTLNELICTGGSSKKSLARLDSLSDLSNIDYDLDLDGIDRQSLVDEYVALRTRFERSLTEIRALKRELRTTQTALDGFEVTQLSLKQQWAAKESDYASQLNLMAARIEDLTAKMGSSDKQVRISLDPIFVLVRFEHFFFCFIYEKRMSKCCFGNVWPL